jgi:hypothetical protein
LPWPQGRGGGSVCGPCLAERGFLKSLANCAILLVMVGCGKFGLVCSGLF